MASYYTTKKEDVLIAISKGRRVEWDVMEEYDDHWKLHIRFYVGADDVVYTSRAFLAYDEKEARKKAAAQFTRFVSGKYVSRPSLSQEFKKARKRLQAKIEQILAERKDENPVIKNMKIDWNAKRFKLQVLGRPNSDDFLKNYEPEYSEFAAIFKSEIGKL